MPIGTPLRLRLAGGLVALGGAGVIAWAAFSGGGAPPEPAAAAVLTRRPLAAPATTGSLAGPAARWSSLSDRRRMALARGFLAGPGRAMRLTVAPRDLARQADALRRLGTPAGGRVESLLQLAVRLVDPSALVDARQTALSGSALRGMSATAAADVVGVPDLRLGTPRAGVWYFDLGPSQTKVTVRGGRVVAVADVTSAAFDGAALGPGAARSGTGAVAALPDRPLPAPAAPAAPGGQGAGAEAARQALAMVGTPYVWGGEAPGGFDCSGLVRWSYRRVGLLAPRVAADQAQVGIGIARQDLQPGDVVFFADASGYVHHDGIYVGNGMFVHAPHTGAVVRVQSLDTPRYAAQYAGARRYAT
jgi:cell wall-associated NlpC family hydrolase